MGNPIFDRFDKNLYSGELGFGSSAQTPGELNDLYGAPAATASQMGRLTHNDVVNRGFVLFGLMLMSALATWFVLPEALAVAAMMAGVVVTLVLGLVIAFTKSVNVPLILGFAVFEGLLVGGASRMYESLYEGVVPTAVVATSCVCAAVFMGWKSGVVRVTAKSRRIFMFALMGYALFALVNLIAAWLFRANDGWGLFAFGSPISIAVSVLAVGLASYSFAVDMDSIDRAVAAQVPEKYSWVLAHGLLVTVVWLYLEMLRLIAQLRNQ